MHDLCRALPWIYPKRNLTCISRPRHTRSPQRVARDKSKTQSRLHFAPSTRTISAEGCARPIQNATSPAFRALDRHDLRRGLRLINPKRNHLTCVLRPRRARSPQRTGCARPIRPRHARSLQRVARDNPKRNLTCISFPRHARSPQRAARAKSKTQSHLHFASSTHTISAEGCLGQIQLRWAGVLLTS